MKKFIVISIVIAAAIAVFAAVALKDGIPQTAETAKPAAEKQIRQNEPGKTNSQNTPVKIGPKLKIKNFQRINRPQQFIDAAKKIEGKKRKESDPSKEPQSCSEVK